MPIGGNSLGHYFLLCRLHELTIKIALFSDKVDARFGNVCTRINPFHNEASGLYMSAA